jgi:UDP-N-acetylmuramoylalanine--D-glutamate ligase
MNLKGKRVTVMGLGLIGGGIGVVKWLVKQRAKILVTDLKSEEVLKPSLKKLKNLPLKYILGRHRLIDFKNTDLIIKNPAVSWKSKYLKVARAHKIPVKSDISLFFQMCPVPIIGVTGTKGKSTTVSVLGDIFKGAGRRTFVAGNIGQSPLEFLPALSAVEKKPTVVVLELSAQQLEDLARINQSPHMAVITNIFSDHLNRYQNIKAYIEAKKVIYKYQKPQDYTVLNYDNKITRGLSREVKGECFYFSTKRPVKGVFVKKGFIIFTRQKPKAFGRAGKQSIEQKVCSIKNLKISGKHNLENILAAISVSVLAGLTPRIIRRAIKNFKGIPCRLEFVRQVRGVKYYNDTTATMPEATMAALETFRRVILIAGGADKGLKFKELAKVIKNKCKAVILLAGTATPKLRYQIQNTKYKIQIINAASMKEAVKKGQLLAKKGDTVLLSPACASFGMFQNEFDRGRQFCKYVRILK